MTLQFNFALSAHSMCRLLIYTPNLIDSMKLHEPLY